MGVMLLADDGSGMELTGSLSERNVLQLNLDGTMSITIMSEWHTGKWYVSSDKILLVTDDGLIDTLNPEKNDFLVLEIETDGKTYALYFQHSKPKY